MLPPPSHSHAETASPEQGFRFSRLTSILSAIIILAGVVSLVRLAWNTPPLERVPTPERALNLLVGRSLDLEEVVREAPAWEQGLYAFSSGGREFELAQAIRWFEELTRYTPAPSAALRLAVLQGDAGHVEWLQRTVEEWRQQEAPFSIYARLVHGGYLATSLSRAQEEALQAELAEVLPDSWFYDRLAIALAEKAGDRVLADASHASLLRRGTPLLTRSRWLTGLEVGMILSGCFILLLSRGRRREDRPGAAEQPGSGLGVPPPWRGRDGAAVLLRGGALAVLVTVSIYMIGGDDPIIRFAAIPMANVPVLLLARRYLTEPNGMGLVRGLGLMPSQGAWPRLWSVFWAVIVLGLLGEWAIDRLALSLQAGSHWTEWFDADLIWAPAPLMAASLVEYILFAPFFEELVFRGLLFGTLRRKFAWPSAAMISAAIFALAHGYGFLGFASVLWSGMLWAWAYNRTGSLVPGMVAHSLNNLMVCVTELALVRW